MLEQNKLKSLEIDRCSFFRLGYTNIMESLIRAEPGYSESQSQQRRTEGQEAITGSQLVVISRQRPINATANQTAQAVAYPFAGLSLHSSSASFTTA